MLKKTAKKILAESAKRLVKICVHKGCLTQDDIIDKLSTYINVDTTYGQIKLFCPGQIPIWRANTFFALEPETLEWIDSFVEDSIFFDIGANVGLYSLYAGIKGHQVVAFEPYSANQYILNKNIYINNLDSKITALSAAVSNRSKFSKFYMQNMQFGSAENTVGMPIDWQEKQYAPKFKQGVMEYSLDDLIKVNDFAFPNYIKIDVDGVEDKILLGAINTFRDQRLKEVLVELDQNHSMYKKSLEIMSDCGFKLSFKKQSDVFANGKYKDMFNHLFVK